jgi:hypothetical protein
MSEGVWLRGLGFEVQFHVSVNKEQWWREGEKEAGVRKSEVALTGSVTERGAAGSKQVSSGSSAQGAKMCG